MPIHFTCPHCGATTDVADVYAGQSGPCASCGKTISIPSQGTSPFGSITAPSKRCFPNAIVALIATILLLVVLPGVVSCLAMFVSALLPSVQSAREAARRASCSNNLRQIGLAMHNYHDKYNCFPPAFLPDENGKPKHSWRVLLLPFLDEKSLYAEYRFDEPWEQSAQHGSGFPDARCLPLPC